MGISKNYQINVIPSEARNLAFNCEEKNEIPCLTAGRLVASLLGMTNQHSF